MAAWKFISIHTASVRHRHGRNELSRRGAGERRGSRDGAWQSDVVKILFIAMSSWRCAIACAASCPARTIWVGRALGQNRRTTPTLCSESHRESHRMLLNSLQLLARAHLIVHDWGGPIGLGTMLPLGDKLGRVVILNTAAFADTVIPARIRLCRIPGLGEIIVRGFNGFAGPATWMAVTKPLPDAVKRGFVFPYDSHSASRIATPIGLCVTSRRATAPRAMPRWRRSSDNCRFCATNPCAFSGVGLIFVSTGITMTVGRNCCRKPGRLTWTASDTICSRMPARNVSGKLKRTFWEQQLRALDLNHSRSDTRLGVGSSDPAICRDSKGEIPGVIPPQAGCRLWSEGLVTIASPSGSTR